MREPANPLHPSDHELLLALDGELSRRRATEIRSHLEACWQCRARRSKIESTIVDFIRIHVRDKEQPLPSSDGPRALLRARLAESAAIPSRANWTALRLAFQSGSLGYMVALFLVVALGARTLLRNQASDRSHAVVFAQVLPDPRLTPGATRPIALRQLCEAPHEDVVRSVPSGLQRQVLSEYGVPNTRLGDYEVDYLITPGLGGAEDIRNLWPEPHTDSIWNSYVKDQLEERLHDMVCSGQLDLATAQQQIASNWIAAYKKYFGADHPLAQARVLVAPPSAATSAVALGSIVAAASFRSTGPPKSFALSQLAAVARCPRAAEMVLRVRRATST